MIGTMAMYDKIVVCKNRRSRSAVRLVRSLREQFSSVRMRNTTGPFVLEDRTFYINWGVSRWVPRSIHVTQSSACVRNAVDKRAALDLLSTDADDRPIDLTVEHTTSQEVAKRWLQQGHIVVARTVVRGHSGEGIVLIREESDWVEAPLYTQHFPCNREYRVHVCGRETHITQKRRRREDAAEGDDAIIRTYGRGWIFTNENLTCNTKGYAPELRSAAISSIGRLGLIHGAVDILVDDRKGRFLRKVIEVNTAPALESPTTLAWYTDRFLSLAKLIWRNECGGSRW